MSLVSFIFRKISKRSILNATDEDSSVSCSAPSNRSSVSSPESVSTSTSVSSSRAMKEFVPPSLAGPKRSSSGLILTDILSETDIEIIDESFALFPRYSEKPIYPSLFPPPPQAPRPRPKLRIVLEPTRKMSNNRAMRRQMLCPRRKWHQLGDVARRHRFWVIREEDEDEQGEDVGQGAAPIVSSAIPITVARVASESARRQVRFAHSVMEICFPPREEYEGPF